MSGIEIMFLHIMTVWNIKSSLQIGYIGTTLSVLVLLLNYSTAVLKNTSQYWERIWQCLVCCVVDLFIWFMSTLSLTQPFFLPCFKTFVNVWYKNNMFFYKYAAVLLFLQPLDVLFIIFVCFCNHSVFIHFIYDCVLLYLYCLLIVFAFLKLDIVIKKKIRQVGKEIVER